MKAAGRGWSWDATLRYAMRVSSCTLGEELRQWRIKVPPETLSPRKLTSDELNLMRQGPAVVVMWLATERYDEWVTTQRLV